MPGNVCSTVTTAPGVTPSDRSRSLRPAAVGTTSTTMPRAPTARSASGRTALELNAKVMEDIVQPRTRHDRDRRDDAEDGEPRLQPALAHHHQEVRDAR